VANLRHFFRRYSRLPVRLAYALTVAAFLWVCSQFYLPGKGFTYLIMFGAKESARFIPQLRAVDHYELENSSGYDGAFYAEIAMQPKLTDPALRAGVDNLAYRARRILFCWTAYGLALGDPVRALHIFSVQNIACWLLLAGLMLRWFPATGWGNFFRWFGVLFSYGMCFSLRGSLVDGPSLLLIGVGVALAEAGRPWWSALVLGVSGLGKETNILGGIAPAWPAGSNWRDGLAAAGRGLVVVLPILVWVLLLRQWLGGDNEMGMGNFSFPLAAYFSKWHDTLLELQTDGWNPLAGSSLLMLVALTTQWLFFAWQRHWRDPWWRLAAVYSIMMIFLGQAVWEGYPGAASRVLLPMTLAFNILLPRRRAWWVVFLLGNLTVWASFSSGMLKAPALESYEVTGESTLRLEGETGRRVEAIFDDHWYSPERSRLEYWRWSSRSANVTLRNPYPFPILATVSFGIRSKDARTVGLWQGSYARWERKLDPGELREVKVRNMRLEPGDTLWEFKTDAPAIRPDNTDPRLLAFRLRELTITILGKADVIPPAK